MIGGENCNVDMRKSKLKPSWSGHMDNQDYFPDAARQE